MNFLKFRSDNQICKILKVDSIKKKNIKAELFLSVFVISAFWTFLDDHDPTEFFFSIMCELLCILGKESQVIFCCLFHSLEFSFLKLVTT